VLLRQHLLAYRIAESMGGNGQQDVLLHWAAAKINASPAVPDFALKEALAAKMSKLERPKYARLAAHAQVYEVQLPVEWCCDCACWNRCLQICAAVL
jgi:hypothetical protein